MKFENIKKSFLIDLIKKYFLEIRWILKTFKNLF